MASPLKKAFEAFLMKGKGMPEEGMEILQNPPAKEIYRIAEEAPGNQVRVLQDENLYAWPAYYAEHIAVDKFLRNIGAKGDGSFDPDILELEGGKFHPAMAREYLEEEAEMYGQTYEDVRKDYMSRFGLPSLLPAGALGSGLMDEFSNGLMQDSDQNYASGGLVEDLESSARGIGQAATLGMSDEIMANIGSVFAKLSRPELFEDFTIEELYDVARANARTEEVAAEQHNPWLYYGSQLPVAFMLPGAAAKSIPGMMATGAGYGAAYGYGDSEAEDLATNLKDALYGSVLGAGFGAAMPAAKYLAKPAAASLPLLLSKDARAEE